MALRRPGAGTELAIGDGACMRAGGTLCARARACSTCFAAAELRFHEAVARAAASSNRPDAPPPGTRTRLPKPLDAFTPRPLLVEDAQIVLAVRHAKFGRLTEPAERRRFIQRRAFAAREIDAEIVHRAPVSCAPQRVRSIAAPPRDRLARLRPAHRAWPSDIAPLRSHDRRRGEDGPAPSAVRPARDALQRQFILRRQVAGSARLVRARRCAAASGASDHVARAVTFAGDLPPCGAFDAAAPRASGA